jgi:RHS repeat-associated protein
VISASGTVENRDAYDPYGNVTSSSGTLSNPFGYTSGYADSATGLVQLGTRYYNPSVGLFTQEDPSGQSAGYLYVGDSPVNGTDPTGQITCPSFIPGCGVVTDAQNAISGAGSCIGAAGEAVGGGILSTVSGIFAALTSETVVGFAVGLLGAGLGATTVGQGVTAISSGACG